jgi:CRP-like cAMP-binding protein
MAALTAGQIASSPIFEGLPASDIQELLSAATRMDVPAGEAVFVQGEPDSGFFVVVEGSIQVSVRGKSGQERILGTLGPGSVVGETSMLVHQSHSATAYAVGPAFIVKFPDDGFEAMLASGSIAAYRVVHNMARVLATRLRLAEANLAEKCSDAPGETVVAEDDLDRLRRIFFTDWGK